MSVLRRVLAIGVLAAVVVSVAVFVAARGPDASEERLGGATLVGGAGDQWIPDAGMGLDELWLDDASRVLDVESDGGGRMWILTTRHLVRFDEQSTMEVAVSGLHLPAGQVVVMGGGDQGDGELVQVTQGITTTYGDLYDLGDDLPLWPSVRAAHASSNQDGELLISSMVESRVVAIDPDGSERPVVVPAGEAESNPGGVGGAVVYEDDARLSPVGLADGRIVLAANALDGGPGDGEVHVIEDGVLRRVETTARHPIRRIFPGPDGRVLALAGPDISLLDPDSGEVELVVDVSAVGGDLEPPASSDDRWLQGEVAATALGDDLVFVAQNRIWRLDDAFA